MSIETFSFVGEASVGHVFERRLEDDGFTFVEDVSKADAVLVYALSQSQVEDLFFETEGLIQKAQRGSYLINLSATAIGLARELNMMATVSDLRAIEAPLVLEDMTAKDPFSFENLTCLLAGEDEDINEATGLLESLAARVHVTGQAGTAQKAKAMTSLRLAAELVACVEAEALNREFGDVSPSMPDCASDLDKRSFQAASFVAAMREERFKSSFTVQMWMAELTAALASAEEAGLSLPGAEACLNLLALLALIGGASLSPAALILLYGEESRAAGHGLDWALAAQGYPQDTQGAFGEDYFKEDEGDCEDDDFGDEAYGEGDFEDDDFEDDEDGCLGYPGKDGRQGGIGGYPSDELP
jgi:3-hydroxyisobutyrate dehydrogenase